MSRKSDQEVSKALLSALKRHKSGPVGIRQLLKLLKLPADSRRRVRRLLRALVGEGKVISEGRGRYSHASAQVEQSGLLVRGRGGTLLVEPEREGDEALRIHPEDRGGALVGDRVRSLLVRRRVGGLSEGRITEILERGGLPLVGVLSKQARATFVIPDDAEAPGPILVDRPQAAEDGDVVAVIVEDAAPRLRPRGRITEVLGKPGELSTEVSRVALEHHLSRDFPPDVEAEAAAAGADPAAELRVDLRSIPHLTIDPPDAKDFDDAVYIERSGKDFRLLVSIADVSAFVPPGRAIDSEAYRRGCSVYFPGGVFPMLPSRLSEDLCTLAPGRDRTAVTVELELDARGAVRTARFLRSLIRSAARLNYQEVQEALDGNHADKKTGPHRERLQLMEECARLMLERLQQRGALDLDLPETQILLHPDGHPEEVRPSPRYFSHRIIEMFMIAANEAVARALQGAGAPTLFRVHPPPDPEKMEVFTKVAESLGVPVTFKKAAIPSPKQLSNYLASLQGRKEKENICQLLLRSLMQARYSAACDGHYGLASSAYLHFTSPIRRYPDLAVHRQLCALMWSSGPAQLPHSQDEVAKAAELCSRSERMALDAERAAVSLYHAAYMQDRLGEVFEGVVSAVFDFGVFVRALPSGVEGLVHISRMTDDYYKYMDDRLALVGRRSGRTYRMGTSCRVRVESVQLAQARVDFEFAGA